MAAAQADNPEVIAARFNEHATAARVREIMDRTTHRQAPKNNSRFAHGLRDSDSSREQEVRLTPIAS